MFPIKNEIYERTNTFKYNKPTRRFNQISVLNYSKYKINNTFLTATVTVKWYSKKEPNRSVKSEFVMYTLRSKKCLEIMH